MNSGEVTIILALASIICLVLLLAYIGLWVRTRIRSGKGNQPDPTSHPPGYIYGTCDGQYVDIALPSSRFSIGSASTVYSDSGRLSLRDQHASRDHAMIDYRDGNYYISDQSSLNGLQVQGKDLKPGKPHRLKHNDEILIGHTKLTFHDGRVTKRVPYPPLPPKDWVFQGDVKTGGMARVYAATYYGNDPELISVFPSKMSMPPGNGRGKFALKVPKHDDPNFDELCAMLVQEGKCLEAIGPHSHIVGLYTYGHLPEPCKWPFLALEFISDGTLADRLTAKGGKFTESEAVKVLKQLTDAVEYIHKAGYVHCDLRPENILLQGDTVKITDFGIAVKRDEERSPEYGSPRYFSPEHAEGRQVTRRSDVYMLGCVMYEMLTGHVPFEGTKEEITRRKNTSDAPPIRDAYRGIITISDHLNNLINSMLTARPADRIASASEVGAAL